MISDDFAEDTKSETQDYYEPEKVIKNSKNQGKSKTSKAAKSGKAGMKKPIQITQANIIKLDPDTISQRLIESVGMVTDLLQSNRQLRDSINIINNEKETIENDNCILQSDNLELRDRIEILESIIKANANDYENYDWK
jgi:small-conductance mechanosensitive channel